tara:strand:- start:5260 stop:5556 length:297 start_codon:yes stop_codon:yes gene_type:complete
MNKIVKQLKRESQKLARLERSLMSERERSRKQDTRNKIQLGGLVIKAGVHKYSKAEILGLLIEAKELLNDNTKFNLSHCRLTGDKAFRESKSYGREKP